MEAATEFARISAKGRSLSMNEHSDATRISHHEIELIRIVLVILPHQQLQGMDLGQGDR